MYYLTCTSRTKALLCKANLIKSIIQEHKCKKHLSYGTIFLNFIYNFHTRLGKGKVLKHFENFNEDFWLKFRLSLNVLKIITLPQVLKKGIDIQLRESFSKSPSRMSQVHVLAV